MKTLIVRTKCICARIRHPFLFLPICLFLLPSFLFADQSAYTYDKQSIRYPSMDTGQVWARSGVNPSPFLKTDQERIRLKAEETPSSGLNITPGKHETAAGEKPSPAVMQDSQIMKNEAAPETEAKKRVKLKRIKALHVQANGNNQKLASLTSSSTKTGNNGTQKTSASKSDQLKKISPAQGPASETQKASRAGKNWHHKQELYDVECGLKLARVVVTYYFDRRDALLSSKESPDAQWYHIYPGSFEEKLYMDICHPR